MVNVNCIKDENNFKNICKQLLFDEPKMCNQLCRYFNVYSHYPTEYKEL